MKIIFVELDRCLACRNCEQVCSFQEAGGFKRENSNIWVQIDLEKRSIFTMTCQQCERAFCLEVCPTKGLIRDPKTNAVVVDEAACIGCKPDSLARCRRPEYASLVSIHGVRSVVLGF